MAPLCRCRTAARALRRHEAACDARRRAHRRRQQVHERSAGHTRGGRRRSEVAAASSAGLLSVDRHHRACAHVRARAQLRIARAAPTIPQRTPRRACALLLLRGGERGGRGLLISSFILSSSVDDPQRHAARARPSCAPRPDTRRERQQVQRRVRNRRLARCIVPRHITAR